MLDMHTKKKVARHPSSAQAIDVRILLKRTHLSSKRYLWSPWCRQWRGGLLNSDASSSWCALLLSCLCALLSEHSYTQGLHLPITTGYQLLGFVSEQTELLPLAPERVCTHQVHSPDVLCLLCTWEPESFLISGIFFSIWNHLISGGEKGWQAASACRRVAQQVRSFYRLQVPPARNGCAGA